MPQSLAIISGAFPKEIRGRAIGTWAGAASITTALGPALGGFLDRQPRLARRLLDQPARSRRSPCWLTSATSPRAGRGAGRLDWPGGVARRLASALLTLGLTALAEPGHRGWPPSR